MTFIYHNTLKGTANVETDVCELAAYLFGDLTLGDVCNVFYKNYPQFASIAPKHATHYMKRINLSVSAMS